MLVKQRSKYLHKFHADISVFENTWTNIVLVERECFTLVVSSFESIRLYYFVFEQSLCQRNDTGNGNLSVFWKRRIDVAKENYKNLRVKNGKETVREHGRRRVELWRAKTLEESLCRWKKIITIIIIIVVIVRDFLETHACSSVVG